MKLLLLACFIAAASALPRKPLGSEKCTWGPAYWCKNYKQATECNAMEHCRRHVWKSNDLCGDCKSVITEIHDYAQNNGTEILALLNLLCDQLGSVAEECKMVVSLIGKTLLETITELTADSDKLCKEFGLCSKTKKEIHHTIMKVFIKQLRSNPTITNLKSVKADYCEDCKLVFGEIKDVLEDKDLQKDIIGIVEKFCGELGSFASECKSFVDSYGPLVLQEVSSLIDPASICAEIGLCNSTKKVISAVLLEPAVMFAPEPKIFFPMAPGPVLIGAEKQAKVDTPPKVSVECVVCEFMMKELDGILGENATKEEIEKALDEVCSILPSTIRSECQKLVNEYAPEIIELLLQELQPDEICTELGLCSSEKKLLRVSLHKKVNSEQCDICKLVIQYAESALKSNATEKEVKEALDAACNRFPSRIATQCLAAVDKYLDTLVKLILQKLSPEEICKEIGLCTAEVKGYVKNKYSSGKKLLRVSLHKKVNSEECELCKLVIQYAESALKSNATEKEIEEALDDACKLFPSEIKTECLAVVNEYLDTIIKLILQKLSPEEICKEIGLCTAGVKGYVKNKCFLGESYWCANYKNALKCEALQHCNFIV